jgi:transcriptional regulator with XRE-family HTH domain
MMECRRSSHVSGLLHAAASLLEAEDPSFAESSGFTQQYISGLETGRRNPTVVTLFELASTLGVSHVDLVIPDDAARSERAKSGRRK